MLNFNFANHTNFQLLEVVDRGSETQLQVTENFKLLTRVFKGLKHMHTSNSKSVIKHVVLGDN